MKKIIITFIVFLLVGISSLFLYRKFFGIENEAIFAIFKSTVDGHLVKKSLHQVPDKYLKNYKVEVLEESDDFEVLTITDHNNIIKPNFVVLHMLDEDKYLFIKSYPYPFKLNYNEQAVKEVSFEEHVSYLISLEAFNLYLKMKGLKDEKAIVDKYVFFLSRPNESFSYHLIKTKKDIQDIVQRRPPKLRATLEALDYHLLDINALNLQQEEGLYYYWVYNKGLIKFKFSFDEDGAVENVESEILGFLGNEPPVCC